MRVEESESEYTLELTSELSAIEDNSSKISQDVDIFSKDYNIKNLELKLRYMQEEQQIQKNYYKALIDNVKQKLINHDKLIQVLKENNRYTQQQ